MDKLKRYQVWYERRMIKKLYNSCDTFDQADQLRSQLVKQYPRNYRFYIIETESFQEIPFKDGEKNEL